MQQLSQLGRSTTTDPTDPIEHFSQEKSLLKIIAKIFSYSLTTLLNGSQVATRTKAATQQSTTLTSYSSCSCGCGWCRNIAITAITWIWKKLITYRVCLLQTKNYFFKHIKLINHTINRKVRSLILLKRTNFETKHSYSKQ